MVTDEIHLEGFAENLKGHYLYCIGSPKLLPALVRSRITLVDSEVAQRGRKVLIVQEGNANQTWLLRLKWDAVFVLRESSDLRLALTYITNCARPVRVVWSASSEPTNQVFQVISKCEGLTLIGMGSTNAISSEWHAIFWTHDMIIDTIESALNARVGAQATGKYNISSVLKEVRASDLGLVWSSIGASDKRGLLYWFDPSEGSADSLYSRQEAADLLRTIAESITLF